MKIIPFDNKIGLLVELQVWEEDLCGYQTHLNYNQFRDFLHLKVKQKVSKGSYKLKSRNKMAMPCLNKTNNSSQATT